MNHCAEFDATSLILAGEIRNRTNKHTHANTVTDILRVAYRHEWIIIKRAMFCFMFPGKQKVGEANFFRDLQNPGAIAPALLENHFC